MPRKKVQVKISANTFKTATLSTVKAHYLSIAPICVDTQHKNGEYTIETRSTIKYFCALFEIALKEVSEVFLDEETEIDVAHDRLVIKEFLKA